MTENPWYEQLRNSYRPDAVRVVFVGESAPDPGIGSKRFFYSGELTHDNLFRGLMLALYDATSDRFLGGRKPEWLSRFQYDGFWLLDVADRPINKLTPSQRSQARRDAAPAAVARIAEAHPTSGVIVCHGPTFTDLVAAGARDALRLLHDEPIPFPLGNWRAEFATRVREALTRAEVHVPQEPSVSEE
jgi:hypothetical protein